MPKRDRECGNKQRHTSKAGAFAQARRTFNVGMNVYKCTQCNGWHIGKTRDPARSANRIVALLQRHEEKLARRMES